MNNKILIPVVAVLIIVGGYFVVRHQQAETSTRDSMSESGTVIDSTSGATLMDSTTEASSSDMSMNATSTQGSQTREVTVTGSNYSFVPATITVNQGDTVKIHFVNSVGFHDFKLDEFNVATARVQGGQSADVSFVADKAGSFEYYCSVGTHRQMGMKGTLIVK